jgi:hypothetical protein
MPRQVLLPCFPIADLLGFRKAIAVRIDAGLLLGVHDVVRAPFDWIVSMVAVFPIPHGMIEFPST